MVTCNTTLEDAQASDVPLSIGITFHHLGLIISAATGLVAIFIASYLIVQHALHYSVPNEQKHIIRILFMIPVYAMVSFLSYLYYRHAIYFEVVRDCYEAFAIASFFTLLCNYLAPTLHDQKDFFRVMTPKNWIWPLTWMQKCSGGQSRGWLRKPVSGLTWFNIIYLGVFQYCLIRVLFTIVSVAAQAGGRYCMASLNPAFAHIWALVFEGASVSVAMYALIQFYYQLRTDLANNQPFLKLLCIKLVIFFSFWQTLVISFLSSANGPLQPTNVLASPDIQVGIPSMLLCIEMAIFSVLHLFAFPWRKAYAAPSSKSPYAPGQPYQVAPTPYLGGFLGWKAFADAFNPWDILKAVARGFRWLFVGRRTRKNDISYQSGVAAGGWGGEGAFGGPEDAKAQNAVQSQGLQSFDRLENHQPIPLNGGPPKFQGYQPHGTGHMRNDEDDTWTTEAIPGEDPYRQRHSFETNTEDRAGLLRNPAAPGRAGVSPARSERSEVETHSNLGLDDQYTAYGQQHWGQRHPGA